MHIEDTSGPDALILRSDESDSMVRIDRHDNGKFYISIAARDNSGTMQIEGCHVSPELIIELNETKTATFRSPTAEERASL